ncbi:metallophosphoesterase family protein [Virgibacillus sediminis]|uniref:Exonuclease SbcCD subunit D n=1 Tax=Virgibacillus sediminis TaxID=202260 RepID=A0ABV7A4E4_9BACI
MGNQVTFLHAADLHLDSPFIGLAEVPEHLFTHITESTFRALDRLVQAAIDKQVDFVLMVGDIFDQEVQSLKAQIRLRRKMEELKHHNIQVYASYGNHDFIKGSPHRVSFPDNVHIFPDEQVSSFIFTKEDGTKAAIHGFSYENRGVTDRKADQYIVTGDSAHFQIATLHGSLQSNTEHDVYAPFRLGELVEKEFDYWALGHIHKREVLHENPPVIYPGNIQGRNRKEQGEKGCYYVTLSEEGADYSFLPLQEIMFDSISMDITGIEGIHQLEKRILEKVEEGRTAPRLIDLKLIDREGSIREWSEQYVLEDLMELVNETISASMPWSYIFRFEVESGLRIDEQMAEGEHFIGELIRNFSDADIQPFLKDLYQQKQARKYLAAVTDEEEEEIKEQAEQMLIRELLMK